MRRPHLLLLAYPILTPVAVLELFAGLAYVHLDMNGFTESGPVAGLTSGGLGMNIGYGTLGLRAATTMEWDGTTLISNASLAWSVDRRGVGKEIGAQCRV
jgi:uncharacterized protein with beta-barrel porin domain